MRHLVLAALVAAPVAFADTGAPEASPPTPEVRILPSGWVHAEVVVPHDAKAVMTRLERGAWLAAQSPEVLRANQQPAGACDTMHLDVRGLFSPFKVTTTRCPTADGFVEHLSDASIFSAWNATWTVTPADGGTRVQYAVYTDIKLPVPSGMLRKRTASSVYTSMAAVVADLDRDVP